MRIRWESHIGKYLHRCDECGEEFYGPKNKLYCRVTCKAKHNNDLASFKRKEQEELTGSFVQNVEILRSVMGSATQKVTVLKDQLLKEGFDETAPCQRFVHEGARWFKFDSYAIRETESPDEFVITRIQKS